MPAPSFRAQSQNPIINWALRLRAGAEQEELTRATKQREKRQKGEFGKYTSFQTQNQEGRSMSGLLG
jgi:hypothetical protein